MGDRTKIEERWWVDSKIHDIAVIMSSLETLDNVTVKALLQELNLPQKQVKTTEIEDKLLKFHESQVKSIRSLYVVEERMNWKGILACIIVPILFMVIAPSEGMLIVVLIIWFFTFCYFLGSLGTLFKGFEFDHKVNKTKGELLKRYIKKAKEKDNVVETTNSLVEQLDKDNNGIVDILEDSDFRVLLNKHQEKIKALDTTYLQKFVKVSSWLQTKKSNIQQIFKSIKDLNAEDVDIKTTNNLINSVKAEIHVYEQVLFNALNMVSALIDDDLLTFYEIENAFDELNMFDSKLEKDISEKLSNIGNELNAFVNTMNKSSNKIIESVQQLTYVTAKTNERLEGHLKSINSSIKVGNIINSINTYQNWRQKRLSDVKSQ